MKSISLFLVGTMLMFPTLLYAQTQEYKKFRFGIKAGAAVAAPVNSGFGEDFEDNSTLTGIFALYGDYRFGDMWAIEPEIGFTVIKDSYYTRNYSTDGTRPKLYIAPSVKFYIPKAKGLHLTLGPELGITARRLSYGTHYPLIGAMNVQGDRLRYNPVALAVNAGIGYRFNKGVSLNAEYSAGLTRITHKNSATEYNTAKDGMLRFTIAIDLYRRSR